ncbi:hypothetical protein HOLleu_21173 [Holothuria leucospilota]|uniref:SRCR domain-containing protein n=1 Tax=Holothuria leucospilota TaxID=206669 RepID=A0A9Q1BXB0_HOLLE|nr:hypothetical protein HOLleu_21173 [Holothuria leucospilota]
MSKVQCQGNETSISSCRHKREYQDNCTIDKYAGVTCQGRVLYGISRTKSVKHRYQQLLGKMVPF